MKLSKSNYGATRSNFTVAEAIETRIDDSHDYYGSSVDDTRREVSVLVTIISDLCQILVDKNILDKENVSKLVGHSFEVE